jgi:hypothetical protein
MAHIAPEQVEPDRPYFTYGLSDVCQATEIAQRHSSRLNGGYATANVAFDLLIDVKSQFVVDFGADSAPSSNSANVGNESREHA